MSYRLKLKKTKIITGLIILSSAVTIGAADYLTGVDLGFSIFYLIPVMLAGLTFGYPGSVIISVVEAFEWMFAKIGYPYPHIYLLYWNSFVRLLIFLVVGITVARLKLSVEKEKVQSKNLRELNQALNRFIGIAAHDLRNPIGIIQMYSLYLLQDRESGLKEHQVRILNIIKDSSSFMLRLVEDLLDISKIESGNIQLNMTRNDYASFLRDNVDVNRILASRKRIRIRLKTDEGLPDIMFDRGKLTQVLNNLISNAVNYSEPGSNVEISANIKDDDLVTMVKDHGPGIKPEDRDKVFREFQRGHCKATGGEKSTGLGLAIARKIVEGHRGRIGVRSEPGKGSEFYFTLPLHLKKEAAAKA